MLISLTLVAGCLSDKPQTTRDADDIPDWCIACEITVDRSEPRAFEPSATIHPTDADAWVISSNQWHPTGVVPSALRTHATLDGGISWHKTVFPDDLEPDHPLAIYELFIDGNVLYLDDGSVLLTSMAASGTFAPDGTPLVDGFDVIATRSTDGGLTWPAATIVAIGTGLPVAPATYYHDQPFMDQGPDGTIVLAWSNQIIQGDIRYNRILVAESVDGGESWTTPVAIAEGGALHRPRVDIDHQNAARITFQDINGEPDYPVFLSTRVEGADWQTENLDLFSAYGAWVTSHNGTVWISTSRSSNGVADVLLHQLGDESSTVVFTGRHEGLITPVLAATTNGSVIVSHQAPTEEGNRHRVWAMSTTSNRETYTDSTPIGVNERQGLGKWPILGDYHGIAAHQDGVLIAWISGDSESSDLQAAWLPAV